MATQYGIYRVMLGWTGFTGFETSTRFNGCLCADGKHELRGKELALNQQPQHLTMAIELGTMCVVVCSLRGWSRFPCVAHMYVRVCLLRSVVTRTAGGMAKLHLHSMA